LDVLERAKKSGKTLVVVHHDLSTAAEYFDKLILIKQRMYAYGTPRVVLNEELLSKVYEGRLRIFSDIIKKGDS
ncbi:MAG: manganese ABC transporter ATP-binding protein, partial [Desulfofustis sp.]|nr:manganese ABC transporter ATP-binding protein [Desulfofustis sp.]